MSESFFEGQELIARTAVDLVYFDELPAALKDGVKTYREKCFSGFARFFAREKHHVLAKQCEALISQYETECSKDKGFSFLLLAKAILTNPISSVFAGYVLDAMLKGNVFDKHALKAAINAEFKAVQYATAIPTSQFSFLAAEGLIDRMLLMKAKNLSIKLDDIQQRVQAIQSVIKTRPLPSNPKSASRPG